MKKKILFLTLFLLFTDIITKVLININYNLSETRAIIIDFFSITKVYNEGASFSMFIGGRYFFIILAIAIVIFLIKYLKRFKKNTRNIIAFSLLFSGIIGNMIDRIIYGHVIDFLDFIIFGYDFPIFNFADICIVFGVILLSLGIIKKEDCYEVESK